MLVLSIIFLDIPKAFSKPLQFKVGILGLILNQRILILDSFDAMRIVLLSLLNFSF